MVNYTKSSGGKVVMINLQKTPRDSVASMVIHERVDKVMAMVMQKLQLPIPELRRTYWLRVIHK